MMRNASVGREQDEPSRPFGLKTFGLKTCSLKLIECLVSRYGNVVEVIEAGAAQRPVSHTEARRPDDIDGDPQTGG